MLLALAPIALPLIVAGIVVGAVIYRVMRPKKVTGSTSPYDPDVTGGLPSGPSGASTEPTGAPYVKNPSELTIASQLVAGIADTPGATLAAKMTTCTFPMVDTLRISKGGSPVNRCWRDQNKTQSEVGWISNLAFWLAYPTGPELLKYGNSAYASAWRRINTTVKSKLSAAGLLS